MKIIIMGDGAWGSALASLLEHNKKSYTVWHKDLIIPPKSILIGAIPTQAIREVLTPYKNTKEIVYVNSAKGIERKTHDLPFQIVTEILDTPDYFTLMGPSFAEEVVKKMPTLVNLGYKSAIQVQKVKDLFQTDYFRVKTTRGIRSLELAAAFKNIYAIACGVTDGLGFGMNTRVKIMLLAMDEFNALRTKLDYTIDERALPATIGDLVLTCSSEESRNFTFGKLLTQYSATNSLKKIGHTVEGYYTVESVPYFEKETGVKLPLARFVYEITHSSLRVRSGQAHAQSPKDIKTLFSDFVKTT